MNRVLKYLFFLCSINFIYSQNYTLEKHWWSTDGSVTTFAADSLNGTLYIGGGFNYVGPSNNKNGTAVDTILGASDLRFPIPNDKVNVSILDGIGGWYVGGDFTKIGDSIRFGIARIDSTGKVLNDFSKKGFNGSVKSLLKDNNSNTLYVGGNFSTYDTISNYRYNGVMLDANISSLIKSKHSPNGVVTASVSDGNGGFYIAGLFTKIGDSLRNNLAHINSFGDITSWKTELIFIDRKINALYLTGNNLYVCGNAIYTKDDKPFGGISVFNKISGSLKLNWNVDIFGEVNSIVFDDSLMYVGGNFSSANGQVRSNLALFDTAFGNIKPFAPNINDIVYAIALYGNNIYVGGRFNSVNGLNRNKLASINKITGAVNAWSFNINNDVKTIFAMNNKIFFGGNFTYVNSNYRGHLAAVDANVSVLKSWNPSVSSYVSGIALQGNKIFACGEFSFSLFGNYYKGFAAFDTINGVIQPWNFNFHGDSTYLRNLNISVSNNNIFVGGYLNKLGGKFERRNAMAINLDDFNAKNWNPSPNKEINKILVQNGNIILVGKFKKIGILNRNSLAKVDTISGSVSSWDPKVIGSIENAEIFNNHLYVSGNFNQVFNQIRDNFAAINLNTGLPNSVAVQNIFSPNVIFKIQNNKIYWVCRYCFNGTVINESDTISGTILNSTSLNLYNNSSQYVSYMNIIDNKIYLAGLFSSLNGKKRSNLAVIDVNSKALLQWSPNPDGLVSNISSSLNKLYISGDFESIGRLNRNGLAALNIITGRPNAWNPDVKGVVYSILLDGQNIYVGGSFDSIGNVKRNNIARIDKSIGSVASWNPNANFSVYKIAKLNNKIYVSGLFRNIGGANRTGIASLNPITGLANSWNAGILNTSPISNPSHPINFIFHGKFVYLNGNFDLIQGVYKYGLAAVDTLTSALSSFGVGSNGNQMFRIHSYSNSLFITGNFTTMNGALRNHIAAVNLNSGLPIPFNPKVGNLEVVKNSVLYKNRLYVLGGFDSIGGKPRFNIAAINVSNSSVNSWNPIFINQSSLFIEAFSDKIFIGGFISKVDTDVRSGFAVFKITPDSNAIAGSLSATTCSNYNWNGNNYSNTGSYYYYGTSVLGYDSTVTLNLTSNAVFASINSNANGSIIASGGSSYQWYTCFPWQLLANANTSTYIPLTNGYYAAVVSNNFGCKDTTFCLNFNVSKITKDNLLQATIYPNPSKDIVSITFSESTGQLEVTDVLGKNKLSQKIQSGESISMKDWPTGIYFFKLRTDKGISNLKVQKR